VPRIFSTRSLSASLLLVFLIISACGGGGETASDVPGDQALPTGPNSVEEVFGPNGPRDGDTLSVQSADGEGMEEKVFVEGEEVPFGDVVYITQMADDTGPPVTKEEAETAAQQEGQDDADGPDGQSATAKVWKIDGESGQELLPEPSPDGPILLDLVETDLIEFSDGRRETLGDLQLFIDGNTLDPAPLREEQPILLRGTLVLESDGTVRKLQEREVVNLEGGRFVVYDQPGCSTQCLFPANPEFDGTTLVGMHDQVAGMSLLPDGRMISVGGFWEQIRLWDPKDPTQVEDVPLASWKVVNYTDQLSDGRFASDIATQAYVMDLADPDPVADRLQFTDIDRVRGVIDNDLLITFTRDTMALFREDDLETPELSVEVSNGLEIDVAITDSESVVLMRAADWNCGIRSRDHYPRSCPCRSTARLPPG